MDIFLICQDLHNLGNQVTESEAKLSRVEEVLPLLQHTTGQMQKLLKCTQKQVDLENPLCHNFRFIKFPKGS